MKSRLLALVVDLLLDCLSLLIGPDKSSGIAVSTIPELAAAMIRHDSGIAYVSPDEDERHVLDMPTPTPKVTAVLPSALWRRYEPQRSGRLVD